MPIAGNIHPPCRLIWPYFHMSFFFRCCRSRLQIKVVALASFGPGAVFHAHSAFATFFLPENRHGTTVSYWLGPLDWLANSNLHLLHEHKLECVASPAWWSPSAVLLALNFCGNMRKYRYHSNRGSVWVQFEWYHYIVRLLKSPFWYKNLAPISYTSRVIDNFMFK